MKSIKVRDLFDIHVSGDIYENIADQIGIYYETGTQLTDAGKQHFKQALDVPIDYICKDLIIIDTETFAKKREINLDGYSFEDHDVPPFVQNLIDLFWAVAGYCSISESKTWFGEDVEDETEVSKL